MLKPRKRLTKRQMKEDKLVTTYFKVMDYVNQNSKVVSGIGIGIVAVIMVTMLFIRSKRNAELSASQELTRASVELATNNEEKAVDILRSMIENYSGTRNAKTGIFYLANIYYNQGKYDEALTYFKKYIDANSNNIILSSSAYSGAGACLEQQKEYLEAAQYYQKGAEKYAEHFEAPGQLMSAARCFTLANNKIEAQKLYQKVVANYPKSMHKRTAELYLSELQG